MRHQDCKAANPLGYEAILKDLLFMLQTVFCADTRQLSMVSKLASSQVLPPALLLRTPPQRGLQQRQCQAMLRALARQTLASVPSTPGRGLPTLAWRQHKHFKHRSVASLYFLCEHSMCLW